MTSDDSQSNSSFDANVLRTRAEQMLRTSRADVEGMSADEIHQSLHELQVHQIELLLQNEELREVQRELANSRDLYTDLYEFAPVGYLTLDRKGRIERANLTAATMLGIERSILVGRNLVESVARGSRDNFHLHLQTVLSEDKKVTSDLTVIGEAGIERVMQLESQLVDGDGDLPVHCRTALIDVTQQREAAEWMSQAKRLRKMVEHLPAGAVFVEHGRIEINRAAEKITGYSRGDLRTLDQWYDLLFGSRQQEVRDAHAAVRLDGFLESSVLSLTHKDGEERIVELIAHAFDRHEVWLLHDVTVSHRDQQELASEKSRLETIVNSISDALMFADLDRKITFCNPGVKPVFGYEADELVGQPMAVLYENPDDDELQSEIRFHADSAEQVSPFYSNWKRKDGVCFPGETIGTVVKNSDGEPKGFLRLIRDITTRRSLERQVLHVAEEEQGRFGRDLHDGLGQELTGLAMMAQSLALDLQGKSLPEAKLAARIAKHIEDSLQQIRTLARGMNPVDITTNGLSSALLELAQHVSELYDIGCFFDCEEPIEFHDSAIATNLFRIAQEAITNSAKHGKAAKIRISLSVTDGTLQLAVSDDGVGIGEPDKIHEGVGMRSMRYRADIIGGVLRVERGERSGTVVSCELPATTRILRSTKLTTLGDD